MNSETLTHLAQRIRDIEASTRPLVQATIPFAPLAEVLPDGGLPAGSLVEILSALEGSGAWSFAMLLARSACGERKTLVVADPQRSFYPPAAVRLGIDLERTLILRPGPRMSAAIPGGTASLVQSLRCPAVGAVIARFERLNAADYRSLQIAAQTGGGVGLLLRPITARGDPSFADIRFLAACGVGFPSLPGRGAGSEGISLPEGEGRRIRRIWIEVLRARGGKAGRTCVLEIDHETGDVRLLPRLADAAPLARSARAS